MMTLYLICSLSEATGSAAEGFGPQPARGLVGENGSPSSPLDCRRLARGFSPCAEPGEWINCQAGNRSADA
jgi:hypothetical protein